MSRSSALFTVDGVPADLVRAGEPRLSRSSSRRAAALERSTVSSSAPVRSLRRWAGVLPA